jgi:DNA mismatch endonuclease (patch repair protein)
MADMWSAEVRSWVMSQIRNTGTRPEIAVRSLLHQLGFRFRLHRRDLPGTPDIVLPKYGTAIFVHGCFWHQHDCPLGKKPKSNRSYWLPKLRRNEQRDAKAQRTLRSDGWKVLTIWECETKDTAKVRNRLLRELRKPNAK